MANADSSRSVCKPGDKNSFQESHLSTVSLSEIYTSRTAETTLNPAAMSVCGAGRNVIFSHHSSSVAAAADRNGKIWPLPFANNTIQDENDTEIELDSDENEKLKAENETLKAALHEKVDENEKLKAALQELRDENEKLKAAQYREDGENEKPEGHEIEIPVHHPLQRDRRSADLTRNIPELENCSNPTTSIFPSVPFESIPEMMPSDVTFVCQEQCGIQSKEQFTTSSSSLVIGNSAAEHQCQVNQELQLLKMKRSLKGRTETENQNPNHDKQFVQDLHTCSNDDCSPNFDCPQLHPSLENELRHMWNQGLSGEKFGIILVGPRLSRQDVKSPSEVIAEYGSGCESDGHISSALLKLVQYLIPNARLILGSLELSADKITVDPRTTNDVLQWILNNQKTWMQEFELDGIFMCILIGGKYNRRGDKLLNEALSSGIIVVCVGGSVGSGVAFPAALGGPLFIGAADGDNVAEYSPRDRAVDFISEGCVQYGSCFLAVGTGIAAITSLPKLLFLQQRVVQKVQSDWLCTTHLKEGLLLSERARSTHDTGYGYGVLEVCSIAKDPETFRAKLKHITEKRNRKEYTHFDKEDALENTKIWSSEAINKRWIPKCVELKGSNVTVALIDDDYGDLIPDGAKYVKIFGPDLLNYSEDLSKPSHGVMCAKVVAHIAPGAQLLLVSSKEPDEMFQLVEKEHADILAISATIHDIFLPQYSSSLDSLVRHCVVMCAAGNYGMTDSKSTISYPARKGDVITIGACNRFGKKLDMSSCGREVDFLALASFHIANSSGATGTSVAVSAAAGFCALIMEHLYQTCHNIPTQVLSEDTNEWEEVKMVELIRNTHQMRAILRCPKIELCSSPDHHTPENGYGMLLIDKLPDVRLEGIKEVIENFNYIPTSSDVAESQS